MDTPAEMLYNPAMMLPPIFRGYYWNPPRGCGVGVLNAMEVTNIPHRSGEKQQQTFWVLDYCFDGGCLMKINSDRAPWEQRSAGVAHLYMPQTSYWEDTRSKGSVTHTSYLCFHLENSDILRPLTENAKRYSRVLDPDKILIGKMLRIVDVGVREGDVGFWEAQAALCEIINVLLHAKRIDDVTVEVRSYCAGSEMSDLVTKVRTFLRRNVGRPVKLREIADHAGVSASTLTHVYKAETGETPMTTHQSLRMNQIRSLLLKGEPLKVIAHVLGFSDIYHLSKYFKRAEGTSPQTFLANVKSQQR